MGRSKTASAGRRSGIASRSIHVPDAGGAVQQAGNSQAIAESIAEQSRYAIKSSFRCRCHTLHSNAMELRPPEVIACPNEGICLARPNRTRSCRLPPSGRKRCARDNPTLHLHPGQLSKRQARNQSLPRPNRFQSPTSLAQRSCGPNRLRLQQERLRPDRRANLAQQAVYRLVAASCLVQGRHPGMRSEQAFEAMRLRASARKPVSKRHLPFLDDCASGMQAGEYQTIFKNLVAVDECGNQRRTIERSSDSGRDAPSDMTVVASATRHRSKIFARQIDCGSTPLLRTGRPEQCGKERGDAQTPIGKASLGIPYRETACSADIDKSTPGRRSIAAAFRLRQ